MSGLSKLGMLSPLGMLGGTMSGRRPSMSPLAMVSPLAAMMAPSEKTKPKPVNKKAKPKTYIAAS